VAGIKDAILDVLAKLVTLQVINQDNRPMPLYARIWNNQVQYEDQGKLYDFPKPSAFVEIVSPATYQVIGQEYRNADISFRIHLVHEFYNSDSTFEQDLVIFDLRDQVIALLTGFTPAGCGPLNCMVEEQDYVHTNIYHYILDFVCNFTDSKGSPLDQARSVYVPAIPPLTLEVDESIGRTGGQAIQQTFLINKK
jgi:hypothetical protein